MQNIQSADQRTSLDTDKIVIAHRNILGVAVRQKQVRATVVIRLSRCSITHDIGSERHLVVVLETLNVQQGARFGEMNRENAVLEFEDLLGHDGHFERTRDQRLKFR